MWRERGGGGGGQLQGTDSWCAYSLLDRPTDLCERRDAPRDFSDPQRSTLHREAVAATAGGARQTRLRDEGEYEQDESGGPRGHHRGFTADRHRQKPEERR